MSVNKRIYVLLALCALSFAASACADATAPTSSPSKTAIHKDGACETSGSTINMC